jgi:hypothetical protein
MARLDDVDALARRRNFRGVVFARLFLPGVIFAMTFLA